MNNSKSTKPPRRNDPCYCGSGKKYKHCHGIVTAPPFNAVYDRIRRYDGESAGQLLRFARKRYGEHVLERAWDDYRFSDGTPFDISGPDGDAFTRWFLLNWKHVDGRTMAQAFLAEQGSRVDPGLRRFIEAAASAPYSFYQTLEVQPGEGLTLRDILRKHEVRVTEQSASTILKRGHIVLARVVELDGCYFFMGMGAQVIPPVFLDHVLAIREYLEAAGDKESKSLSAVTLLQHEDDLREAYFEIDDDMSRPPEIRNTDGDPLAFHTLTYEIRSFEETFEALKELEQRVTAASDTEMLEGAATNKAGKPTELTLHWLRNGYKGGFGDNTTLATLTIRKSRLVVEVNSERRSKRIQKEIKKRLGDSALLLRTEIRSHEGIMKEVAKGPRRKTGSDEHDRLMKESPEARAFMREMREQHLAAWVDQPVPALRGMTPREAAKDPEGRELLESLLMDFELRNETKKDEFMRIDVPKLRKELGMERGLK